MSTESMTRPKAKGTTQRERKHRAILDAAASLFLDRGYAATSMDDVAAEAAVAKQTVYAHFESKEVLFESMVRDMTGAPGDAVQRGMNDEFDGDLEAHLIAYGNRLIEIVRTPELMRLRRLVIGEVQRFGELGEVVYASGPGRAIGALAETFAQLHARGLLRAPDPKIAASHFNWLVMAEPLSRSMLLGDDALPGRAALRRHVKEAVRIFLAAYGPE